MEQKVVKLTETHRELRPGRARVLRDEQCPNLLLVVSKRVVSWKFKRDRRDPSKPKGWATQSATLGPIDKHTVLEARAWAYRLAALTDAGVNPNVRERPMEGWTLGQLWDAYAKDLQRRGKSIYNHVHYGKHLHDLRDRPIAEITAADVSALHDSVTMQGLSGNPAPYSANRVRECLRAALSFAVYKGQLRENIVKGGTRYRNPERKRNVSLPLDGLAWWWSEVAKLPAIRRDFHSLTLLLGLRVELARKLEWDWIDLDDASMTVPPEAMKMGVEWWCPLSREAVEILKARSRERGSPFVFSVRGRDGKWTHIKEEKQLNRRKKKPDELMKPKHPLQHAVGGILRKTYRSAHTKIGTPHAHAEELHAHAQAGIASHYNDPRQMRADLRKYQQAVAIHLIGSASLPFASGAAKD